jgi:biopolymer transport protein ExbD
MALAQSRTAPLAIQPIAEINTTPLIDVLLVLLIMLLLSVPAAFDALNYDLPRPSPIEQNTEILAQNRLSVTATGVITWNGIAVSEGQLVTLLAAAARLHPQPLVRFEPEGNAPYGKTARVLGIVKAADPASFAFAGTEHFAAFGKQP